MKLYLSSYHIPVPEELEKLVGKSFTNVRAALIPNAKDYYSVRARAFKTRERVNMLTQLGMEVKIIDLRDFSTGASLKQALGGFDLVWVAGGNTFCLRYEMKRSGFDNIIGQLMESGLVYGGDSAGALVAGTSIEGVESVDEPEFAAEIITTGLGLVPYVVLPHIDNPAFSESVETVRRITAGSAIELTDRSVVIFSASDYRIVQSDKG